MTCLDRALGHALRCLGSQRPLCKLGRRLQLLGWASTSYVLPREAPRAELVRWEFPKIRRPFVGGPCNEDPTI